MAETKENIRSAGSVECAANLYFSTLNPLAKRIHADIFEMSQAYSNLWNDFTAKERDEVINETLIKPEYVLKYMEEAIISSPQQSVDKSMRLVEKSSNNAVSFDDDEHLSVSSTEASDSSSSNVICKYAYDEKHLSTYARLITGQRQIHEDIYGIYSDEHSAPFSFKSRSQININIFEVEAVSPKSSKSISTQAVLPLTNLRNRTKYSSTRNDSAIASNKSSKLKSKKKSSSKYSIASSINSQNSRKNFMSKLFSSLAHGSGDMSTILPQNEEEKETLFADESNVSLLDMISATQSLNIIENSHRNNRPKSPLNIDADGFDDNLNSCNDFKSLLSDEDLSKDYDFLNNW